MNAPVVRDSAYAHHNASISVGPKSDAWKLSIYAENIGNERYINSIFDLSNPRLHHPEVWTTALLRCVVRSPVLIAGIFTAATFAA